MFRLLPALLVAAVVGASGLLVGAPPLTLSNERITVELDERGLASLSDRSLGSVFRFQQDRFAVVIDGSSYQSESLAAPEVKLEKGRALYRYAAAPYEVEVVYELRPGWRFLSKQLFLKAAPGSSFRVNRIEVLRARLSDSPREIHVPKTGRPNLQTRDYGGFLRFEGWRGLLALVQNPFLEFQGEAASFAVRYDPEMDWKADDGPFPSDRGLLAPYRLSGRRLPARMLPEWLLGRPEYGSGMDEAEIEAFTECVRAFLLYKPERPLNIFVGWCVNDYQIDIATPKGREEYKRVMDRAAELGADYILFAPTNSDISRREDSVDDWGWENLLWLGLGQKIRRNEWNPKYDPVPPTVQEMLDYARKNNLKLVAYVYPVMPFSQKREWLVPRGLRPMNASLGVRSLQDWLIETLTVFYQRTGIGGYSFDHTFLGYEGASRYAQWWGWRRVMETLRERIPEMVMDGRQAYQFYGPWSWLAGSYPHPTSTDEQPESFRPFPDLHFDRVSGNRQRYTAYHYRNFQFAPSEIVPGFITHQTPRLDDSGRLPQAKVGEQGRLALSRFRARDWDYLGWRFSLLSSIATGGWNNVLNMIPARDLEEYRQFSEQDKQWFRQWLEWTRNNKEFLRHTRTILGQPALGRVDGTSAILNDRGYLFLFNPNGQRLSADFGLDGSLGLRSKGRFLLKELYPVEGRLVGKGGTGIWNYGDRVSIEMDGASAQVLELSPAPEAISAPVLFNVPGRASLADGLLELSGVKGEPGTWQNPLVLVPPGATLRSVRVNAQPAQFSQYGNAVSLSIRFQGAAFRHNQQLGEYNPNFMGGTFTGKFIIPARVFEQLAARRKAWSIAWSEEDYGTTWLAPERLLLFVQIAEPDDRMDVRLRIDGQPVELRKAYSSIRGHRPSFVGFYADVSSLRPDREYRVELQLPPLEAGQFQGLFFDNVETEYTAAIAP